MIPILFLVLAIGASNVDAPVNEDVFLYSNAEIGLEIAPVFINLKSSAEFNASKAAFQEGIDHSIEAGVELGAFRFGMEAKFKTVKNSATDFDFNYDSLGVGIEFDTRRIK